MNSPLYAIVEAGGEQFQVEPGRFYDIRIALDLSPLGVYKIMAFDMPLLLYRILLIHQNSKTKVGQPWIKGAFIKGRLLRIYKKRKIIVYKMRSKKKNSQKIWTSSTT